MEGPTAHLNDQEGRHVELRLVTPLRASFGAIDDVLPSLRKARALFVVLALSEQQTVSRRFLAGLLWSRNDVGQGLARLRDTLRTLRQGLKEALGDPELVCVIGDRVALRPGAVQVDVRREVLRLGGTTRHGLEIAADLNGLDPALDEWLAAVRSRLGPREQASPTPQPEPAGGLVSFSGSIIGICALRVIGAQADVDFATGLAEEIASALARNRGLVVISTRLESRDNLGFRELRQEYGVDFLLDGSLQRLGSRVRITVKLVDAATSVVCWNSVFEYDDCDLFHVQQDVAGLVAAGLEPELPIIAAERIKRSGRAMDGAYTMILRAISRIHRLDRAPFMEAGDLLGQAIAIEPDYSAAYSWLALWHVFLVGQGWAADPHASIARAGEVAEHAVMLDPNDARGLAIAGHVRAFLHHRLDEALPLHERALQINPSLPLAWHLSGVAQAYKGNLAEARRRIEHSRHLAPRDPHSFFADGASIIVELLSGNYETAAALGRRVTQLHPRFSAAYKPYLAALGHLGEREEAAVVHGRLLQLEPDFSVGSFRATSPFERPEHLDRYTSGLSLAGVA